MVAAGGSFGRESLSFRSVNRRGSPDYDPGLQRHHLLPRQLLSRKCFTRLLQHVGRNEIGFDDFRRNGILLPAREEAVRRTLLPLHRGPHRDYNAMVIERMGCIESCWAFERNRCPVKARAEAVRQIGVLQNALRRRLLDQARPILLNRREPALREPDFSALDAMAETLWKAAA